MSRSVLSLHLLVSVLITPFSDSVSAQINLQSNSLFENPHLTDVGNSSHLRCPPWSYFDLAKKICNHDIYFAAIFYDNQTHLRVGYCSTYNEKTGIVSFSSCPYFQSDHFHVYVIRESNIWTIQLPENISTLNQYMCGPLNRKGTVCSECVQDFGPAVTSVGFSMQCSYCSDNWYGIPYYTLEIYVLIQCLTSNMLLMFVCSFSEFLCYYMYYTTHWPTEQKLSTALSNSLGASHPAMGKSVGNTPSAQG